MKGMPFFTTPVAVLLCLLTIRVAVAQEKDLADYVNTLQGTNSSHQLTRGNTYPTTALPFAMHTWTPQTGRNGDGWKYQFAKDSHPRVSAGAPMQLLDQRLRRVFADAGDR